MGIEQLILFIAVARRECFFRKRIVFSEKACIYSPVVFIFYKNMRGQKWGQLGGRLGRGSDLPTQCSSGPHGLGLGPVAHPRAFLMASVVASASSALWPCISC